VPLPAPRAYGLPVEATIAVPVPSEGIDAFRLLLDDEPRSRDFEPNLSRAQAERQGVAELFRVSISHWLTSEQAASRSARRRYFVGRLHLRSHPLVRVALTEQFGRGHLDVWGPPSYLVESVVAVERGGIRP
jgi:hypothetical protein